MNIAQNICVLWTLVLMQLLSVKFLQQSLQAKMACHCLCHGVLIELVQLLQMTIMVMNHSPYQSLPKQISIGSHHILHQWQIFLEMCLFMNLCLFHFQTLLFNVQPVLAPSHVLPRPPTTSATKDTANEFGSISLPMQFLKPPPPSADSLSPADGEQSRRQEGDAVNAHASKPPFPRVMASKKHPYNVHVSCPSSGHIISHPLKKGGLLHGVLLLMPLMLPMLLNFGLPWKLWKQVMDSFQTLFVLMKDNNSMINSLDKGLQITQWKQLLKLLMTLTVET